MGRDYAVQRSLDTLGRRRRGAGEIGESLGGRFREGVDRGAELVDPLGVADPRVGDGLALNHRCLDQFLQLRDGQLCRPHPVRQRWARRFPRRGWEKKSVGNDAERSVALIPIATNPQRLVAIALCHTKDSVTITHSSVDEKRGKRRYRVADRKKIDGQNILLPSLSPQVSLSFCLRGARPVDGPSRSRERRLPAGLDRVSF